jgi:hypothetical protein
MYDSCIDEPSIRFSFADLYRSRYGDEVDRSSVLPVLKALLGHLENGVLKDIDTAYTTYE